MVETKRKQKERKSKAIEYHKYMDMRAIIPAVIIAFIFSLCVYLYVNEALIMNAICTYMTVFYGFPVLSNPDRLVMAISKITFFTIDFVIVFCISYIILWLIVREQDKRLYMEYKKKRLI